ncbi:MAG: prepilin-type N-terminal cleavage/methylation domain-containing protein [Planctomycetota bacterium]
MTTARAQCHGRRGRPGARGFTLLEILLATALMAVLLMGLWSLFSIYTSLFEAGQTRAVRSQLARALLDQLADDLESAIQDPIPASPAQTRTSTPLRRFALFGSPHELRLDVLQVTPLQGNPDPVSDSEELLGEPSAPRVPELRTVYYTFREPLLLEEEGTELEDSETQDPPGLIRRELDFETPNTEPSDSGFGGQSAGPDILEGEMLGGPTTGGRSSPGLPTPRPVDDSVIWAPEVVALEFRYFDGNGWSGQWNSLARKSLPVAVEVTLQLGSVVERETSEGAPEESAEFDETDEFSEESSQPLGPRIKGPTYRLVIDLPGSPSHPAPERVRPIPVSPPPRPAARRPAPPRPPAAEPTVRALPDQWMRTEP